MKKIAFLVSILLVLSAKADVFALSEYNEKWLENGSFEGYLMSEKLDGVRALWDGKALKSRSGKKFLAPECWIQNLPPFALDGELYIGRGKFEQLLSIVSKSKCEEWQRVGYFIFDVPNATGSLLERLAVLQRYLSTLKDTLKDTHPLFIITQSPIKSKDELEKTLQELTKSGGEGLVIRKNKAEYENFRSKNANKYSKTPQWQGGDNVAWFKYLSEATRGYVLGTQILDLMIKQINPNLDENTAVVSVDLDCKADENDKRISQEGIIDRDILKLQNDNALKILQDKKTA